MMYKVGGCPEGLCSLGVVLWDQLPVKFIPEIHRVSRTYKKVFINDFFYLLEMDTILL